ncbi:PhoX family phosphatase [Microbulbifer sp. OS29]|uniref:PhoX family phosphatase n=1 Tax=Microbulbifer okhotskensis TaxID=2926617 RepID=A0A9X2ES48_9GAMM|nr:PhoX family phosphatase [Microbulbifer okhotskensis]MCO1334731.1 PhoX family phosphatase [Microbulbifer okhotskensis]
MNDNPKDPTRRSLFKILGSATAVGVTGSLLPSCNTEKNGKQQSLTFNEIPQTLDFAHHFPVGYRADILLRWGDPLHHGENNFEPEKLTPKSQQRRFGYNNDFIAFMPLAPEVLSAQGHIHLRSKNSHRGLLCVNHEYTQPHLMFSGYNNEYSATQGVTADHVAIEQAACGHSIVEIEKGKDGWQPVTDSPYNRRITATTAMEIAGPAAGDARLKTHQDPSGTEVLGTIGNCAGGKTPWGTVLIAEEGFGGAFQGNPELIEDAREAVNHRLFGIKAENRNWGDYDRRFDIQVEPNEPNRFGWMVEFDPYDPQSKPRKLTSLGRFEHEGFTLVCKPEQPVVAYGGDDDEGQFVYRFVSQHHYQPDNPSANWQLLTEGTLYAARFADDGNGQWLPLIYGQGPLTAANGFRNQADVMIDTRRAAAMLGATPMDRPEDVETNPHNDCTYVMLTKNKKRGSDNLDAANPRARNIAGHILEIVPPGVKGNRDHSSASFQWQQFLLGGNPNAENPAERGAYGQQSHYDISSHGWFANPDNVAFDPKGNMWVATDGCERFGFHDGLWAMATEGPLRAAPKHFFGCPRGAEVCGPEFSPDGKTLFIAIQHPADARNSTYDQPLHRWPDNDPKLPPRPSVLAIYREDGKEVGS